jgi:glutathione S-transferase
MRIHTIPHSTNAERVRLALGLKGVDDVEWVEHDPGDRSMIRAISGQDLVPVLQAGDLVLTDSMPIIDWIDATWPTPALYREDPAARREVEGFVTWFNHVWKVAPNAIDAALREPAPDPLALAGWAARLRASRHELEALLTGRDFLFGDAPGAADLCAFPFLRYALHLDPADDETFHRVLAAHLDLEGGFPRLAAWIARMDALPRA